MKITYSPLIYLFLLASFAANSQSLNKNIIEINSDFGLSSNLDSEGIFNRSAFPNEIFVTRISKTRTQNYAFCYSRLFNASSGIKLSIGKSVFGFSYQGTIVQTNEITTDAFRSSYLEFGVSYIHRIFIYEGSILLLEPGLRYHSDANRTSGSINFYDKDTFSSSLYAGMEFPLSNNDFFLNAGLQIKLPFGRYNQEFDPSSSFRPYFVGIKIGVNFQF